MSPALASFHHGRRETLAAVADMLIPSGDGMPSASEAGVAGRWLDEVLQLRPDFGPPLAAVLDRLIGADPSAALTKLRTDDPAGFGVLAEVVAGGGSGILGEAEGGGAGEAGLVVAVAGVAGFGA